MCHLKAKYIFFTDYNVDDIYHYATHSTYQEDGGSSPLPDPPTPVHEAHPLASPTYLAHSSGQQKGFTTVVYQPASIHDVDEPNIVSKIHETTKVKL